MKRLLLVIFLLSVSCANRKTLIKRYVDEAISVRQNTVVTALSNTNLSEKLTIPFRVVEYDTTGRITRETTGEIRKAKEEIRVDSVIRRDSISTRIKTNSEEEIREKKNHSWQYAVIGSVVVILLVLFLYFIRGK